MNFISRINCTINYPRNCIYYNHIYKLLFSKIMSTTVAHKPPNVLVYSEENVFKNIAKSLYKCLHSDKYVIYNLKHNQVLTTPWKENIALLVVFSETIDDTTAKEFVSYVENGGKLLTLCSNFIIPDMSSLKSVIEGFIKLEYNDQKKELYRWKYVYEYPVEKVCTLAKDSDNNAVIVKVNLGSGLLVSSSINLFVETSVLDVSVDHQKATECYEHGLPILKSLLTEHFCLEGYLSNLPTPTSGYVIVEDETRLKDMINLLTIKEISLDKSIKTPKEVNQSAELKVPLITECGDLKSSLFDKECYFSALKSGYFGRIVVFFPVVTSTMYPAEHLSDHPGLVVIANRQISGKGRSDNIWLSPEGCAAFTLHFPMMLSSKLGQRLSVVQHMASLAVVHGLRKNHGFEKVDLRLKWPNDIYYKNTTKIGGVLVNTTIQGDVVHVYVGIGVNISNQHPTVCVNSIIQDYNASNGESLPLLKIEEVIATTLTELESLVTDFTNFGAAKFLDLYYSYWNHKDQAVTISDGDINASVKSIDDYGFLIVQTESGKQLSLQPDGNRFDMLKNLIIAKEL